MYKYCNLKEDEQFCRQGSLTLGIGLVEDGAVNRGSEEGVAELQLKVLVLDLVLETKQRRHFSARGKVSSISRLCHFAAKF